MLVVKFFELVQELFVREFVRVLVSVKLSGDHKLLPSMFLGILTLLIRSSEQKKNVFLFILVATRYIVGAALKIHEFN